MNNIPLVLKRPKLKNLFRGLLFSVLGILNIVALFFILSAEKPITFLDKLLNVSGFCSMSIMALFMFFSLFNTVRNLLSPPTVVLDNNKLKVFANDELLIKDILKTELIKQKSRTLLKVTDKDKNEVIITQNLISIPLKTLEYAIHIRVNQLKADNT